MYKRASQRLQNTLLTVLVFLIFLASLNHYINSTFNDEIENEAPRVFKAKVELIDKKDYELHEKPRNSKNLLPKMKRSLFERAKGS